MRGIESEIKLITEKDLRKTSEVLLSAELRGEPDLPKTSKVFKAELETINRSLKTVLCRDTAFSRQIALGKLIKPSHRLPDPALHIPIICSSYDLV